ncbi:hypothetical protein Tco_0337017 [Tanacetum coccineum]
MTSYKESIEAADGDSVPKFWIDMEPHSYSSPFNNEAIIEGQLIARVESRLEDKREEMRAEMRNFYDQAVNKSKEPYDDKRDNSNGDSDSISKSSDCDDVSTDTSPTTTSHLKDVVTESLSRYSNINPDSLGNSGVSPKDDDATLYDDEYNYESKRTSVSRLG